MTSSDERWLKAEEVAKFLGVNPRQVTERLRLRPDFPQAIRMSTRGEYRWNSVEIAAWAEAQRIPPGTDQPKLGRPRAVAA